MPHNDEHKPAANGVLAQMEQGKEKEDKEESESESVRIETAGLVNGDMGDGSAEQDEDHSSPQTDRTDTESHNENEDSGTTTESEQRNEEGSTDHKVRTAGLLFSHICFVCNILTEAPGCCVSAVSDKQSVSTYLSSEVSAQLNHVNCLSSGSI